MIKLRYDRIIVKLRPLANLPLNLIAVDVGKTWAKTQIEAEVICVGPYVEEVKPGDVVLITGAAGHWIDPGVVDSNDRDSTYRYLTEEDILGIVVSETQEAVCTK